MRRRALLAVMVTALTSACETSGEPEKVAVPVDSAAGELAFAYTGPDETAIVLPVHINGKGPYEFVLDTGATLTCVDQALSTELELPKAAGSGGFGVGIGKSGQFGMVAIDSFRIGAASANGMSACVLDLSQFAQLGIELDGLIGLNFLKSFRVSIDFERQVVVLQDAK